MEGTTLGVGAGATTGVIVGGTVCMYEPNQMIDCELYSAIIQFRLLVTVNCASNNHIATVAGGM